MSHVTVGQVDPQTILTKIGGAEMAFAESYKGEGSPSDDNFQQFNSSWRRQTITEAQEIWLEMFKRQAVAKGVRAGYNFCEFWGWPEIQCRDDGTARVASRIRIIRVTIPHQPRTIQ